MAYIYCQNTECGNYLGSLGASSCNVCNWIDDSEASKEIANQFTEVKDNKEEGSYLGNFKKRCPCCP